MPEFSFAPASAPHPELVACYGPESQLEFEVVDHLCQLTEALRTGRIGFEWWTALTRAELARVGW